jgi:hypothetical protein
VTTLGGSQFPRIEEFTVRKVSRLPGRADGAAGLLDLAKLFGDAQVFDLIMLCRTAKGDGQDPGGEALTLLGNRLIEKERAKNPAATYDEARRAVAELLGYQGSAAARSNFYKILRGGRHATDGRRQD